MTSWKILHRNCCLRFVHSCVGRPAGSLSVRKDKFSTLATDVKEEEYDWDPKSQDVSKQESPDARNEHKASHLEAIQHQLLSEALKFVPNYGWSARSFTEAARSLSVSPSLMSSFSKSEDAALVLFFLKLRMVDLENFLIGLRSKHMSEFGRIKINLFVFEACKEMLSYVIPYLEHWPDALSILAELSNALDTFEHHKEMVDLIWHYAGDKSLDYNWYSKRILLSAVINSSQLHLIQDKSDNFEDTWRFLEERLKDVASIGMGIGQLRNAVSTLGDVAEAAVETGRNLIGLPNTSR